MRRGRTLVGMANRIGGYPKDNGRVLADGHGNQIGRGRKIGCTRIRPGQPGSWISNERCSYQFIVSGKPYSCRGYGDGVAVSCREMKKAPRGLAGSRKRRRR